MADTLFSVYCLLLLWYKYLVMNVVLFKVKHMILRLFRFNFKAYNKLEQTDSAIVVYLFNCQISTLIIIFDGFFNLFLAKVVKKRD